MTDYIHIIGDEPAPAPSEVGGKAMGLIGLRSLGLPVPAGYVVTAAAFDSFTGTLLRPGERLADLVALASGDRWDCGPRLSDIRRRILSAPMPRDVESAVVGGYDRVFGGTAAVAVRSSSSTEDQDDLSSAGMQESFLNVRGREAVVDAVRSCWASLWHERAISYLAAASIDAAAIRMGVIVQEMVDADAAGTVFTVNPTTANDREILVNAVLGLGETAISGRRTPDVFILDKSGFGVRDRQIAHKDLMLRPAREGAGLVEMEVPNDLRDLQSVDDGMLSEIAKCAVRIEGHIGRHADVEWAVSGGKLLVLQARPVTAQIGRLSRKPHLIDQVRSVLDPRAPGRRASPESTVWTNANVGEAIPGPATPLTWSVALAFQEKGFEHVFRVIGCRVPPGVRLVGSFQGRFYLNLSAMLDIAMQVPVLDPREALEMGGVSGIPDNLLPPRGMGSLYFVRNLPFTMRQVLSTFVTIDRDIRDYEEALEGERREVESFLAREHQSADLARLFDRLSALLDRTGTVMLSCMTFALASHLLLRQAFEKWFGGEAQRLERDVMSGFREIESALPGLSLWHISETIRACPEEQALLRGTASSDLGVDSFPQDSKVRHALSGFMASYGYRGIKEAELASPRWSEDPTFLFETLKSYLSSEKDSVASLMERQKNTRTRAARDVEERLGLIERSAARHMLDMARKYTRLRERMRARVVGVLGLFRKAALAAGRRLAGDPDAAFFLRMEEIKAYLEGRLGDPARLIRERREQHERDLLSPEPPSLFIGYPPQWRPPARDSGRTLMGVGASPGRGEGLAHVLRDPASASQFKPGQVLVIPHADVGWTPLFLVASAIVTDIGGVLSHAAVVAREYGVPMVMNTRTATSRVKTGDALLVDGDRGVVYIL